jgi:ETC complex I subunit conserved region
MLRRLAATLVETPLRWPVQPVLATAVWSQVRGLKATTGLVGLDVDPQAREHLIEKAKEVLAAVQGAIPEDAQYRKNVEATYKYWLGRLESDATQEELEDHFNLQLEHMIKIGDEELGLIPKMAGETGLLPIARRTRLACGLDSSGIPNHTSPCCTTEWKPWEVPEGHTVSYGVQRSVTWLVSLEY